MIGVSVPQVFNKVVADLITYFQCVEGFVVLFLGPFGMTWVVVSKCTEISISSIGELGSGCHGVWVPCGVLSQLGLLEVEGSHQSLSRALIVTTLNPPVSHKTG